MITLGILKERCKPNAEYARYRKVEVYKGDLLILTFESESGLKKRDFVNRVYYDANDERFTPSLMFKD